MYYQSDQVRSSVLTAYWMHCSDVVFLTHSLDILASSHTIWFKNMNILQRFFGGLMIVVPKVCKVKNLYPIYTDTALTEFGVLSFM